MSREQIRRIIETCRMIEEKGLDPFSIDVEDFLAIIREMFPDLESIDDLILDSEAVEKIASVIKLQSEWVKKRTTSLYTDPFLIQEKLKLMDKEVLARILLKVWRPVVELEQVTTKSLSVAADYWRDLLPLDVRWAKTEYEERIPGAVTRKDLLEEHLLSEKTFTEALESFWEELKLKVGREGKILYEDFVYVDDYKETLKRAYMTSFLVTYGYADLEIQVFEEKTYIIPKEKPEPPSEREEVYSYPIPVSYEEWLKWREEKEG